MSLKIVQSINNGIFIIKLFSGRRAAGNLMGDAMVAWYQREKSAHKDLQIAVLNGGSVRASISKGLYIV